MHPKKLNLSPGVAIRELNEDLQTREKDPNLFNKELELIEQLPKCNLGPFFLSDVSADQMEILVRNQFFNANVLHVISCITQVVATLGDTDDDLPGPSDRVRYWFKRLRVIGSEENAMGNAMLASWDDSDNKMFLIKAPKNPNDSTTIHELFVGLFGTNSLRAEGIVNFAYVYGGFRCSSPVINPATKEVGEWCQLGKSSYYVIYENIPEATEFTKAVPGMSFANFLNYYLQVLLALRAAFLKCDFSHYDLHGSNVLLHKINILINNQTSVDNYIYNSVNVANPHDVTTQVKFAALRYQTKQGIRYLQTDTIATIIDYGNAHIKYNDKGYANTNMTNVFNKPFLLGDAHRLLCGAMYYAQSQNKELFTGCARILSFFTAMDPDRYIKEGAASGFAIYASEETSQFGLDDLVDHILNIQNILLLTPTAFVLNCNENKVCFTSDQVKDKIITHHGVNNLFDLWDHINRYEKTESFDLIADLLIHTDVAELMNKAIAQYNKLSTDVQTKISQLVPFTLSKVRLDTLADPHFLSQYIYNVSNVMAVVDDLYQMKKLYRLLVSMKEHMSFDPTFKVDLPPDQYDVLLAKLKPYITSIIDDITVAQRVIANPLYKIKAKQNPQLKWLEDVLVLLEFNL